MNYEREEAARMQAATEDMIRMRFQQFGRKTSPTVETVLRPIENKIEIVSEGC
jgi:hypothetical protein